MLGWQQVAPSPVHAHLTATTLAPVLVGLVSLVDATVLLGIGYVIERMGGRYERVLRGIDSIFLEDVIERHVIVSNVMCMAAPSPRCFSHVIDY